MDARIYVTDQGGLSQSTPGRPLPPGILDIRSIALVAYPPDPNKVGYAILRNLLTFPGRLYPVNPKHQTILGGVSVYPSLFSVPDPVDVAVIAVPARTDPRLSKKPEKKGSCSSSLFHPGSGKAVKQEEILNTRFC